MAVDKFSISLPEDLLTEVDQIARADGVSRSAVIREAAAAYVSTRVSAAHELERSRRIDEALAGFDEVAGAWGADERSSLDLLRELRGDGGADEPVSENGCARG